MSGARSTLAHGAWAVRFSGRLTVRAVFLALMVAIHPTQSAADSDSPLQIGEPVAAALQGLPGITVAAVAPDERMLIESDQLVYDFDANTVSAVGNVIIYFGGYTLEADRVTYNQTSGRLIAIGSVKMNDPTGSTFRSEYFDITDDFAEGFAQSLSVETTERTHFEAETAERSADRTVFTNGSYSACISCINNPDKPPFWKIRAKKIIIDHREQVVRFSDASFEFFGTPIAWVPYFTIADPSIKRKSGLLAPSFGYAEKLGFSVSAPYFWALAPNYDLTVTPTVYVRQGPMLQAEWRHRLTHGQYSIIGAGLYQFDKGAFDPTAAGFRDWRGGIRTTGHFDLSRDWALGWDGTLSTDRTFTRNYAVLNRDTSETVSTIHLTGLRDRNYFEARGYYFQILSDPTPDPPDTDIYHQGRQAIVLPVVDHQIVAYDPVFGGELTYTSNLTALYRDEDDPFTAGPTFSRGTAGTYVRATKELAWRKRFVGPMGQVFKPFAYARADAFHLDPDGTAATGFGMTTDSFAYRAMPAVGLDWSLPILIANESSSHIIEPRAQLIVRPDEMRAGELPNNDAQSLVFDETNLFNYDKFSGYDRTEGGTRLNLGVHYSATFAGGAALHGTAGQSFHLAGTNPYASPDLANVGPLTGLETAHSDYVVGATIHTGLGPSFNFRGRFDNKTFAIKRAELDATAALGAVTASSSFVFLKANPNTGVTSDSSVLRSAASVNFLENWRAFGTVTFDISKTAIASDSFGLAYDDESATVSLAYSETRPSYTDLTADRRISLRVQLRTIGDTGVSADLTRFSN